jgi:hypothetical protein
LADGKVVFVHEEAQQFGTFPFPDFTKNPPVLPPKEQQGLWSTYGLDGELTVAADGKTAGPPSRFSYVTNGVANPTLHMRPGEVQRWRLLNATDGDNLQLVLVSKETGKEGLGLNVVAMDAITVPKTYRLEPGDPLVMASGQRMDVMVKAGKPGTYLLQTRDANSGEIKASVSPYRDKQFPNGIDPDWRASRHSFDFPSPCPALGTPSNKCMPEQGQFSYPVTLATIEVSGEAKDMDLPADPLPNQRGFRASRRCSAGHRMRCATSPSNSAVMLRVTIWTSRQTQQYRVVVGIVSNTMRRIGEVPRSIIFS